MRTADWLTVRARTTPAATAIVDAATGATRTYAELDGAVEEMAGRLAAIGVTSGDHVGLLAETSVASVRAVHAVARLGARLVGLNCRLADPELARQLEAGSVDVLLCDPAEAARGREAFDGPLAALPGAEDPLPDGVDRITERDPVDVDPYHWRLDEPGTVLFTSGTTGDPKPVSLTPGNLLASAGASAVRLGVLPDDRWLLRLSIYHMGGLAPVIRSTLYGTAVIVQATRPAYDPASLAAVAREHDATGVSLVPTMLRRLLDAGCTLPETVRFVLLGGAPAPRELIGACADRGVPVCPTYGMTETASQIATARPAEAATHPETVGHPLLGTTVTVVDEEGAPVPAGETGEFVVAGPTVMAGYYGDPEATASVMGEHGLHTGDIGYRDDAGRLYVLNRRSDRILTGGETVNPGQVAEVLRSHPDVSAAAVVGLPDREFGERVAAAVVRSDPDLTADALESYARERLAGYKLPRRVRFVDSLPRTASGTVDREALEELLQE